MSKLTEGDLKGLLEEVTEARKLLARKAEVEREIMFEERRLARVKAEKDNTESDMEKLRREMGQAQANFDHEKKRFAAELSRIIGECAAQKVEAERAKSQALAAVDLDAHSYRASVASERTKLTAEIATLRRELESLHAICRETKARIHALPE